MKRLIILILFPFVAILSCSIKGDDDSKQICKDVIIDNEQHRNAQSNTFEIIGITSEKNCLKITIRYGGGCGEVNAELVDSGDILESDPVQRNLRVVFVDDDACEALIQKDFLFDITNLQIENNDRVLLKFQGSDLTYLYEY